MYVKINGFRYPISLLPSLHSREWYWSDYGYKKAHDKYDWFIHNFDRVLERLDSCKSADEVIIDTTDNLLIKYTFIKGANYITRAFTKYDFENRFEYIRIIFDLEETLAKLIDYAD